MRKVNLTISSVLVVVMLALATTAFAGKSTGYAPTLTTSLQSASRTASVPAGTPYVISGCGYNAAYGMVTIEVFSPVGAGWVAEAPDANGCVSVTNFYSMGPGSYKIDAWQQPKNKPQVVAETAFTL